MASPPASGPARPTGLPPGVETGPLGKRVAAHLIDAVLPAVLIGVAVAVTAGSSSGAGVVTVLCGVLTLAWAAVVWRMFAVKAAGPGMRLMKLQLVGLADGRPVGWGRFLLRQLVLFGLSLTGVGLVIMLVLLVQHPRKQGWHDLVAQSVVIKERTLAPAKRRIQGGPQGAALPAGQTSAARDAAAQTSAAATSGASAADTDGQGSIAAVLLPTAESQGAQGVQPGPERRPPTGRSPAPEQLSPPVPLLPPDQPGGRAEGRSDPDVSVAPTAAATASQPNPPFTQFAAAPPPPASNSGPGHIAPNDSRPKDEGWVVALDEGREIQITGLVLLGRNPQPRPGEEDAQLIKVADETRTVSKSHLGVGADANGVWVMDRGSTNGSTVTNGSGVSSPCPPGTVVQVAEGDIVSFGDHWLEIKRQP